MIKNITFSVVSGLLLAFTSIILMTNISADLNLELPDMNLPDLGDPTVTALPYNEERKQGLRILRKFRSQGSIMEDPEINSWIRSLGNRLAARAPRSGNPFYFVVSRDKNVNAFATIGGVIVINAGLILRTDSESEVAAVLSHEIAHVTQRHIARMIQKSKEDIFGRSAALLAGVAAGTRNAEVGQAIISATLATAAYKQLSFSRAAETEADRVGLRILSSAGYDPQAMAKFMQKLEQLSANDTSGAAEYLQSHPLPYKRVIDSQLRANRLHHSSNKKSAYYRFMKEKIRALIQPFSTTQGHSNGSIKNYAQALSLEKRGQFVQALKVAPRQGKQIPEAVLRASLFNKLRQYTQTIRLLTPLLKIYPSNEALSIPLAQAYAGNGQIGQAWNVLRRVPTREQTSLEFFEVKQQIAHLSRHNGAAYCAAAERNIRIGEYKYAAIQLRQAMKLPGVDAAQLLQYQKLLAKVESLRKDERK